MPPNTHGKDYYKTLGVPETATADEIKKAYRKLAKRYHPDATGGDKAKEAKFKEAGEAYETLGDEKKRGEYDTARKNPFSSSGGFPGGFPGGFQGGARPGAGRRNTRVETHDLNDLFGGMPRAGATTNQQGGIYEMFSELFRGGGPGSPTAERARPMDKGDDVRSRVDIDLAVAALGGDHPVTLDGKRLTIKIPPGVTDGQTMRIAGQGQPGPGGSGDLLIDLHVRPDPVFRRSGDDLEVEVAVPLEDAILGGRQEVPTLEGPAKLTVPPGSSSGLKLRLRGKGARKRGSTERGDLYAVVQVQLPRELPPRAKELLDELAQVLRDARTKAP